MLQLESSHLIVREAILNRFLSEKAETVDVRVADFDDIQYHVLVDANDKNVMKVSISIRNFKSIYDLYSSELISIYGDLIQESPESGFDFTLAVKLDQLPEDKAALAKKLSQVRRNIIGAPLLAMGKALINKAPLTEAFAYEQRRGEFVYFVPGEDRVTMVYDVQFKDVTEHEIARIFLQEFNDIKRNRELASAPVPNFIPGPPQEILTNPELLKTVRQENRDRVGFISFALQERHLTGATLERAVDQMTQFRSYLLYHITCAKSQMHTRMRTRVDSLLKVLNRALPDLPKEKKTASGRAFQLAATSSAGL